MNYAKTLTHSALAVQAVALLSAMGCGGKLLDMPNGYGPADGAAEGEDGAAGDGNSSGSSSGASSSSGAGSNSSGGPGGTATTCGGATCGKGEVCCVALGGGGGTAGGGSGGVGAGGAQKCTAASACMGISVSCQSAAQCSAGQVCCFALNLGGGLGGAGGGGGFSGAAKCQASCGMGVGTFQLCATSAECPKGVTCQPTGYGANSCGGTGMGGGGGGAGGIPGGAGAGAGGAGFFCTSPETPILTPEGERPIAGLQVGDVVLSVDHGQVRAVPLVEVHRQPVVGHHVVSATLANGRVIHISEGHPTADHRLFRDLKPGDKLGDVTVVSLESVAYDHDATYDILPGSDTGTYYAAGALIGSTLR